MKTDNCYYTGIDVYDDSGAPIGSLQFSSRLKRVYFYPSSAKPISINDMKDVVSFMDNIVAGGFADGRES